MYWREGSTQESRAEIKGGGEKNWLPDSNRQKVWQNKKWRKLELKGSKRKRKKWNLIEIQTWSKRGKKECYSKSKINHWRQLRK